MCGTIIDAETSSVAFTPLKGRLLVFQLSLMVKHHRELVFLREQNVVLPAINCSAHLFKANLSDGQFFDIIVSSAGTELSPGHLITPNYVKACGRDSCNLQRNGKATVAELILFTQPLLT